MDLEFTKINYDGELADFSEEELRELVGEFETAQESNVAEFETAAEATENIEESTIEDLKAAREALIQDITSAEAFDEVPLDEGDLEEQDFTELQEWQSFVDAQAVVEGEEADGDDDGDDDTTFDDMGQESPVNGGEETEDFVEEALGDMQGLNL